MKKIILTALCCVYVAVSFAQQCSGYEKTWATYFGGMFTRITEAVTDTDGNIIVAGYINNYERNEGLDISIDSIKTRDSIYYSRFASGYDVSLRSGRAQSIIAKFSSQGNLLLSLYLPVCIQSLKISDSNELYIAGNTVKADLGTANVWYQTPIHTGRNYHFVAKLNSNFVINWLTYIPLVFNSNLPFDIDENENIYVAGQTYITSGITTPNTFQYNFMTEGNLANGYLFKLNSSGNLEWGTYYGHAAFTDLFYYDRIITVSARRQSLSLSMYDEYYFTKDAYQKTVSPQIIAKFDADAGQRIYSTYLGNGNFHITDITVDESNVYLAGFATGIIPDDLTQNAWQPQFGGAFDLYLGKFTYKIFPVWGTYIGGRYWDHGSQSNNQIPVIINNGFVYLAGISSDSNLFVSCGDGSYPAYNSSDNAFLLKFSLDGQLNYGTFFGGNNFENHIQIALAGDSVFYLAGATMSESGISTENSYQDHLDYICTFCSAYNIENGFIARFTLKNAVPGGIFAAENDGIEIYPNPVQSDLYIKYDLQIRKVEIHALTGELLVAENNFNGKISVSSLPGGVYLLKVYTEKGVTVSKIIKE